VPPCDVSLLNFVVSDGRSLVATRYVSACDEAPASLYYAEGSAYEREQRLPEVTARLSAAARALHGAEGMEGVAGARSRPVTGERGGQEGRGGCAAAASRTAPVPRLPPSKDRPSASLRALAHLSCALLLLYHPCRGGGLPPALLGQGLPRVPGGL
jgi:hypothetical protein